MSKMKIEIWSDIACPYCYIGKRKLELALDKLPFKDNVELIWHSYELNPSLSTEALNKSYYQYMADMHGSSVEEEKENLQEILDLAKGVGLNYDLDRLVVTNTSSALRLVKLAKKHNLADQAEEVLFKAYFVDGKNISDRSLLLDLASSIGLDTNEVSQMLDSSEYLDEIKQDMEKSENELDLEYIPFYMINKKHIIQGSIELDEYVAVLEKAYADWLENGESDSGTDKDVMFGKSCSIDGVCD